MDQDHAKVVDSVRPWLLADAAYTAPPSITAGENQVRELTDTISCIVDREINGIYELTMQYPVTGKLYSEISVRSLIYVNPDEDTARQLFRIYRISKPIFGVVTIYARHISYDLGGYVCPPFTASGIAAALAGITANTEPSPCPFVFSSTRTTASTFTVTVPCDIWSLMAGQAGSLLDVYGGEYTFDNFSVTLENSVGADNGVTIEYAKNLTQLIQDEDGGSMYTGIYPYYYTEESGLVQLTEKVVDGPTVWPFSVYKAVDMTDKFQSTPTEAQLRTAAQSYVANNDIGSPKMSLDVDFIPLWQTEEYKGDVKERISLGDTVTIKYSALGVNATARVMATRYNCLKEKYDKLTVGSIRADLGTIIKDTAQSSVQSVQPGTPVATKGAVVNHAVEITPSVSNAAGFIQGGTITGTPITVTAAELVSGTKSITANGQGIDVGNYKYVDVAVPGGSVVLQIKSVTPTESAQVVSPDSGYDGLEQVEVAAIPSTYVGSGITRRSSSDLTASGATVTAPAGYYESGASKAVASGSVGTPTASKGTVSNHRVAVVPHVSYSAGYISSGTKNGAPVTVTAAELVSGSETKTANGTYDVTNLAEVVVDVPAGAAGSVTAPATISNSTQNPATVESNPQLNYASAKATVSVTPNVTTPGNITAGTPGNSEITLTFPANNIRSGDPSVITPGPTAQQVIPAGVTVAEHAVSVAAVSLQTKSVTPTETAQTVTPDSGYTGLGQVNVGAIDSDYVGSGVTRRTASDVAFLPAIPAVSVPAGYYENMAAKSIPLGTEGTPTATKGAVSNHSVSVTPSVTNDEGYIWADEPIDGTPVTVTAAELVSGNLAITENGNNIDVTNYETVSVNVSGGSGKNVQIAQGVNRVSTTSYTAVSGQSITVAKTGTYDVYWSGFRSSTGGTNGSQLYIGNTAHGSAQTTFSNHGQSVHLSNVSLTAGQTVSVRARARGTNYYMYVSNLTIIEN